MRRLAVLLAALSFTVGCEPRPDVVISGRIMAIGGMAQHPNGMIGEVPSYSQHYPVSFQHDSGQPGVYSFCASGFKDFGLRPGVRYRIVYASGNDCDSVQQVTTL